VVARNCNFSEHNLDGWYPPEATKTAVKVYYGQNDPAAIKLQSMNAIKYLRSKDFFVEVSKLPGSGHERHPEVAMDFFRRNWRPPRPSQPTGRQ
jgi:predicted esterase